MLSLYEELRRETAEDDCDGPICMPPSESHANEVKLEIVLEVADSSQKVSDDPSDTPAVIEKPGLLHEQSETPPVIDNSGLLVERSETPAVIENPVLLHDQSSETPPVIENPSKLPDQCETHADREDPDLDAHLKTPAVLEMPEMSDNAISVSGRVWEQPSPGCVPPSWCVRDQEEEIGQMAREQEEAIRKRASEMVDELLPTLPDTVNRPSTQVPAEYDMTDCIDDGSSTDPEIQFEAPGPRNMDCTDTVRECTDTVSDCTDAVPQ